MINCKLIQFVIVLSLGISAGYYLAWSNLKGDDEIVDSVSSSHQENYSFPSQMTHDHQQELELEIKQLQDRILFLEQELSDQEQTAESLESEISNNKPLPVVLTVENLRKVGVEQHLAEDIVRRISEHEFKLLELADRARRNGYLKSPRYYKERRKLASEKPVLRDAIGDAAYDNYLYLAGRNNRVLVSAVMSGSPAQQLGVQKDDVIISYANEKILNWKDLKELTGSGNYGNYVNLTVLRNEQLINILVPRGPLGVKLSTTRLDPGIEYNY